MAIERPYLLFLGDAPDDLAAKTARGIADWRPDWCIGQHRLDGCQTTLGLDDVGLEAAVAKGAKTLVVGVANRGGVVPESWVEPLTRALSLGMDLASGLHQRLSDLAPLADAAARHGRRLIDVRIPDREFAVASGVRRPGKRLLPVGTDVSVGKMYTALAIEREMKARGMKADFRATGQTGILIAGEGVSVDAVVADFISGAAEWLSPDADPDHWDVVEGQGSLFHASYAGVSLGLLHGTQPDALVLCHDASRETMRGIPHQPVMPLADVMEINLANGRLTNPDVRFVGVCLNTSRLSEDEAHNLIEVTKQELGLPCVDPVRNGVAPIVDQLV